MDSSIFVTSAGVNPVSTIQALTLRITDDIKNNPKKYKVVKSLGQVKYLSAMKYVDILIGNSSSGVIEAATFKKPVVNIGSRQKGRLRAKNVIDVNYNKNEIYLAIKKSLYDEHFRKKCRNVKNPYKGGNAGKLTAMSLAKMKLNLDLILKKLK